MERAVNRWWVPVLTAFLLSHFSFLVPVRAQTDDFGVWLEAGVEKKLSKKWSVGGDIEFRTRDNSTQMARWATVGVSAEYKVARWLKASAGYVLLFDHNEEELDLKSDGLTPNKWTPGYWSFRHRVNASLTAGAELGRLSLALRERWQYTYRPEVEAQRYDVDNDTWKSIKGKGKNLLRSRMQAEYDIPHWKLDPVISAEMFTAKGGVQKMRYSAGVEYRLKKKHVFGIDYRFQKVYGEDDDLERNSHVLGLSYKFKF